MPSSRQVSRTPFVSGSRVQSEYSLCNAAIGCTRRRPPQGFRRGFGQSERPHFAGLDQFGHRADRFLDGRAGIDPGVA